LDIIPTAIIIKFKGSFCPMIARKLPAWNVRKFEDMARLITGFPKPPTVPNAGNVRHTAPRIFRLPKVAQLFETEDEIQGP